MRKITLIFALLFAFGTSCLNEDDQQKDSIFKEDILDYLNQLKTVNGESQKIDEIIEAIKFNAITEYVTKGTEKVLIADIKSLNALGKTDKVLALFFMNQSKIVRSRLVTFSNQRQFSEYNKLILAILRMDEDKLNYSGQISFYNSLQMLLMQNVIENGVLKSNGLIRKDISHSDAAARTNTCTDWYLVTIYYYSDGTSETVEEYWYTTCSGCSPDQECDDPNDPYEGGGGGGGEPSFTFPPNPSDGDQVAMELPDGTYQVYVYVAEIGNWVRTFYSCNYSVISSTPYYSYLDVPGGPTHGQTVLTPDNLLFIYDGFSGNWVGQSQNKVCGGYIFTPTGDGLTAEINGLGAFARQSPSGRFLTPYWPSMCVTFGSSSVVNNSAIGSQVFNQAWNKTMNDVQEWLNTQSNPTTASMSAFVVQKLRFNLELYGEGYVSLSTAQCQGNIASTVARYCN